MATSPFSALYKNIRGHVKIAPQPALDVAILAAARRFYQESRYRQISIPVNLENQKSFYSLFPPNTDEEVIRVQAVQYNGRSYPVPLYSVVQENDSGQWPSQYPRRFFYEPPNQLVVLPLPQSGLLGGLSARVVLQPTKLATTLDDSVLQQNDLFLAQGALSILLTTNDSPWTNLKLGAEFEEKFAEGIATAAMNRQAGFKPQKLLTAVPRF